MSRTIESHLWESWESVHQKTTALGHEIIQATLKKEIPPVDRIATIPRGGLYVANIVPRMLGISGNEMDFVGLSRYSRDDPMHPGEFKDGGQMPIREHVEGRHVLLLDEVFDSGLTIAEASGILSELGVGSLTVAVLHYKPTMNKTTIEPDYFVTETAAWVHYPWETIDSSGDLYRKVLQGLESNSHQS